MDELELTRLTIREVPSRPEARARARARLDAVMTPPRSRWRLPALLAAAVLTLALLVAPMLVTWSRPSAAAQTLARIADLGGTVLGTPEPGDAFYRQIHELRPDERVDLASGSAYALQVEVDVEEWIAADLSGHRLETIASVTFATDEDRSAWVAAGRPPLPAPGDQTETRFGPGEMDFLPADSVPTDEPALEDALRSGTLGVRSPDDAHVFLLIGDLLGQGNLPQEARIALLDAAAELEGIDLVGPVVDPEGRNGVALSVTTGPVETELVFDETDGDLLASMTRDARGSRWTVYLGTRIVPAPLEAGATG